MIITVLPCKLFTNLATSLMTPTNPLQHPYPHPHPAPWRPQKGVSRSQKSRWTIQKPVQGAQKRIRWIKSTKSTQSSWSWNNH